MRKYNSVLEAKSAVDQLIDNWSEFITITNVRYTRTLNGCFVDMTANKVSFRFIEGLRNIMNDDNPVVDPIDEETIQIGSYFLIKNDSGE